MYEKNLHKESTKDSQRDKIVKCPGARTARLTAAKLVRAVRAVRLFVTLVTSWDTGAIGQTLKLLRCTSVIRTLSCCNDYIK